MAAAHSSSPRGRWVPAGRLSLSAIPDALVSWLLDSASLTQRLNRACDREFRLEVLGQRRERPLRQESRALGMAPGAYALVRQVHLCCGGTPWVYARTVIPPHTLSGKDRRLAHLRHRSLGAVLFADPSMRRGEVEVTELAPHQSLHALATARLAVKPQSVWGRRSLFHVHGKPLLVSEFFLPALGRFPA